MRANGYLAVGSLGYEPTEEGVAVLSEVIAGGMSRMRLRTLAARALAVDAARCGATFGEVFRQLVNEQGVPPEQAWTVTIRVFRGGAFHKDHIYLAGMLQVLDFIQRAVERNDEARLKLLFCGKLSLEEIEPDGLADQLLQLGVLDPPTSLAPYAEHLAALPGVANEILDNPAGAPVLDRTTQQ